MKRSILVIAALLVAGGLAQAQDLPSVEDVLSKAHRPDDLAQRIVNYKRGLMEEDVEEVEAG